MNIVNNPIIEGLYEAAAGVPDDNNGLPKFEEQQLRKYLENTNIGVRNKELFSEGEPKFHTCPRYNPCPICDKCMNKASHLYKECEECRIPICVHKYSDKDKMIKRRNFVQYVTHETMKEIKALDAEVCGVQEHN